MVSDVPRRNWPGQRACALVEYSRCQAGSLPFLRAAGLAPPWCQWTLHPVGSLSAGLSCVPFLSVTHLHLPFVVGMLRFAFHPPYRVGVPGETLMSRVWRVGGVALAVLVGPDLAPLS